MPMALLDIALIVRFTADKLRQRSTYWVALVVGTLPAWVERRRGDGDVARAAALGLIAALVSGVAPIISARTDERSELVGRGRDAFLADRMTADVLADVAEALRGRKREETLAVLPEGVMINYLARRVNPTGHVNFMPPRCLAKNRCNSLSEMAPRSFSVTPILSPFFFCIASACCSCSSVITPASMSLSPKRIFFGRLTVLARNLMVFLSSSSDTVLSVTCLQLRDTPPGMPGEGYLQRLRAQSALKC